MRQTKVTIIPLFLFLASWTTAQAQTLALAGGAEEPMAQVVVTFTFPSAGGDYSIYRDDEKKDRFYIKFAAANLPSYQIAPATAAVRLMVDNDRSDQSSLVFWIPVLSGTSPRVDRNQSALAVTFIPSSSAVPAA